VPETDFIIDYDESILITGSNGFIGASVVESLLRYGFKNLRCFVRSSRKTSKLKGVIEAADKAKINVIQGNLLSEHDCEEAARGVSVVYHLAASTREKAFAAVFANSVDTTRNVIEAILRSGGVKRFVNVSSFAVYSNAKLKPGAMLDETCEIESKPELRGEAYCYAKVKQEELVQEYAKKYNIPYVIVRPGVVYGPGNREISGRLGISRFGFFLHLGGSNRIPLTYVDNCADAIVLAGLKRRGGGEIFNVVDDDSPTSEEFLKMYKKNVRHLKSIYLPKAISYFLCYLWERCSNWSGGRLPSVLNRKRWSAEWKGNKYSNEKLKRLLGWKPKVSLDEGLRRYFEYCRKVEELGG